MKVTPLDFILSTLFMTFLGIVTVAIVGYGIAPITRTLDIYAGITNILAGLLVYGILSGITIQMIQKIHPLPTGEFEMNSPYFTQFKLMAMITDTGLWAIRPFRFLALTPVFLMLFGAKVGKNFGSGSNFADPYMVRIGNNVVVGNGSEICGNATHNGKIRFGYINIGNNVTIGMHCTLLPNVTVGDGATILIGSVVMPDTIVPPGETWRGNPARKWG